MKLLAVVYFLFFLRHGIIFPFIPLYAKHLGANPFWIGIVISSFSLLSFFLAFPIGIITDKITTKFTLFLGVLLNIFYSISLMFAKNIGILILAQFIGGVGFLFMIVGTQIFISSQKEKQKREMGFGMVTFAAAVGQTLGPFLGGLMFSKIRFVGIFEISLMIGVCGVFVHLLKEPLGRGHYPLTPKKITHILKEILNPYMKAVLLFCFVVLFAISLRSSFLPILLKERSITEKEIGFLLSSFSFAMSFIRMFIGRIMGVLSRATLLKIALILIGVGTAILPLVFSKSLMCVFISLTGLGFGISQPISMVMVSDAVPIRYLGISFGIRFSTITFGTLIGPFLFGLINQRWGIESSFYTAGILVLISIFFIDHILNKS